MFLIWYGMVLEVDVDNIGASAAWVTNWTLIGIKNCGGDFKG